MSGTDDEMPGRDGAGAADEGPIGAAPPPSAAPPEALEGSAGTTIPGRPSGRLGSLARSLGTAMTVDSSGAERSDETPDPAAAPDDQASALGRFTALGLLGVGGMGEVLRAHDPMLHRSVALKLLTAGRGSSYAVARFREEAQLTAQLQHPGVVPVYEFGMMADGRLYYTMQEVRGRTLDDVISEAHAQPDKGAPALRRLVDICHQACETVAYAHSKGVVHRDLKPANIMVGEFGEVRVMDWGIAKALGRDEVVLGAREIASSRGGDDVEAFATRVGEIMGTPMYMAPEQARGEINALGPHTDVYALGAVLFRTISGDYPYARRAGFLQAVQAGQTQPLTSPFPLSSDLRDIVARAMAPAPADRYPDARALSQALGEWLEGARQQALALREVAEAEARVPRITALRERATALRAEARRLLAPLEPYTPVEAKRAAWDLEAKAAAVETEAAMVAAEREEGLRLALHHAPDLPEAHAALALLHAERHREVERKRDPLAAVRYEARVRTHFDALPADHPVKISLGGYLAGAGALSLVTDPPGLEVELFRYEDRDRRRHEVPVRSLGPTPLRAVALPHGDYVCRLANGDGVAYPVRIGRQVHWDGVAPGEAAPRPVRVPEVPAHCALVPAGYALLGEPAEPVWVDGFVIRRRPITNGEYLVFINGLVGQDRAEDAVRFAPAAMGSGGGYSWRPEYPAARVSYAAAAAYAEWLAGEEGLPWRLPTELEWEKAARGVDGRRFPWGDAHDPTWCRMRDSQAGPGGLAPVDAYPDDVSPYGVLGMGGNLRDWIDGWFDPEQRGKRVVRGGAYSDDERGAECSARHPIAADGQSGTIGIRLVRAVD